jgi:hypothetical protein
MMDRRDKSGSFEARFIADAIVEAYDGIERHPPLVRTVQAFAERRRPWTKLVCEGDMLDRLLEEDNP